MRIRMKFLCLLFGFAILFLVFSCERKTSPTNPNQLPNTTLANIPVDGDTLFALVTLHWDGEDNDGFISSYQYRYITHHLSVNDSVIHDWVSTTEPSITIPFESSDIMNYQIFQIRAVDNNGDADPTPAEKRFYTVQTIFPESKLLIPQNDQQFFGIDQVTDWWQGIQLTFTAHDEDGEVVEFAWAVDDQEWNWTSDTTIFITPEYFSPLDGEHTLRVTSRDNTNLIDPTGDSVIVKIVKPVFNKDILIIDETVESLFPFGMSFSDAEVDDFYAEIFNTNESWDFTSQGMPSKQTMGQYKLIVWHADNIYTNENDVHKLPAHIRDVMDYMNVGGDFIMSGWRVLKSFAVDESFPKTFEEGSFIHDYLHILQAEESAPIADFNGAYSSDTLRFSDITIDSVKLSESFYTTTPVIGLLYVNLMPRRAGFTDVIYRYRNDDYTGIPTHRSYACGLRYYGTSFDAIVLGFPMFFIRENDAKTMAAEMVRSLGY